VVGTPPYTQVGIHAEVSSTTSANATILAVVLPLAIYSNWAAA
jgi:hypothetical protein